MPNTNIDNFKKEFKALLEKYDAEIYMHFEGDTEGVYDEQIEVMVGNLTVAESKEGYTCFTHEDIKI
jgi:hypothetical protein